MTTGASSGTVRMRRLGQALAEYRKATGLTQLHVAEQLGWSPDKLIRLEGGQAKRPRAKDIERALDLYGVKGRERDAMIELVARRHERDWWVTYRDVFGTFETYVGFEQAASAIETFNSVFVPGLLQTPEYAAALFRVPYEGGERTEEEVERRVLARATRSMILKRANPPKLSSIITEGVARQAIGGAEVMRGQLAHLIEAARPPHVTVQLVPFSVGAAPGLGGPVVIFEFPDPRDGTIAYREGAGDVDDLFIEDADAIRRYRRALESLRSAALSPEDTARVLAEIKETF